MLSNDKINLLIEKYFREHLGIKNFTADDLVSGKEYFKLLVDICQEVNEGFPNFDLLLTNNIDRYQPEKFFFALCDEAFRFRTQGNPIKVSISSFNEEYMRLFYAENINAYVSSVPLDRMHDSINNLSIVEKFKLDCLGHHEWLTDVDLAQMTDACRIENAIITPCNFSNPTEAINNLGVAFHFKRADAMKKSGVKEVCIPLLLEVGSSLSGNGFRSYFNQGSHWVSAIAHVNLESKEIDVTYMNSMSAGDPKYIENIFQNALNFTKTELNAKGEPVQFTAFPGFSVKVNVDEACLQQHNGWSCGYFAFKNLVNHLPDNGHKNFASVKECNPHADRYRHPYSNQLRECYYKILLKDVKKEHKSSHTHSSYPVNNNGYYHYNDNSGYYHYYNNTPSPTSSVTQSYSDYTTPKPAANSKYIVTPPVDDKQEQAWQEIKTMALKELEKYQGSNKPNKQNCTSLIHKICCISSMIPAARKVELLISYLDDQKPDNSITAKLFGKLKGRKNAMYQPAADDYYAIVNNIKSQIVRVDKQEKVYHANRV